MPDDKPNLDLIDMVQRARMQHDSETKPSEVAAVYWIEAKCPNCTPPGPRSGQWVLNIPPQEADATWEQIKQATEAGKLGYKSKISTASRVGGKNDSRTICVRTYDHDDSADAQRVRGMLDKLGITGEWTYEKR